MSASNTTPRGAQSETVNQSSTPTVKKVSATSSRVPPRVPSLPSKSRNQAVASVQSKRISSPEYKPTVASPSSPTPSRTYWQRCKSIPGDILVWLRYKLAAYLVKRRNRQPVILLHPDKRLKRIAEMVNFDTMPMITRVRIVRKMSAALGGVTYGQRLGLAAPQIDINYRVVIVRGNVMFNPSWVPSKAPLEHGIEGCYSVPGKVYTVMRAKYGWATWQNIDGKLMQSKLNGTPAIVFQHELDHLNGTCCADVGEEIKVEPGRTPPVQTK